MTAPTMTAETALALRKPFPKESIGKLPKGGTQLDYVGHAAVTDRLLTVDPLWTWEPLATDDHGLPALDRAGNLWIRLTICGVTRIGVGDGKSAKECIGDAIRNAAMRFGVALDLWAKEDLVEFAQAARAHTAEPRPPAQQVDTPPPTADNPAPGKRMTPKQRALMFALFGQKGVAEADQLSGINAICGTHYESRGDLTEQHAKLVIDRLQTMPDVDAPAFDPEAGEVLA